MNKQHFEEKVTNLAYQFNQFANKNLSHLKMKKFTITIGQIRYVISLLRTKSKNRIDVYAYQGNEKIDGFLRFICYYDNNKKDDFKYVDTTGIVFLQFILAVDESVIQRLVDTNFLELDLVPMEQLGPDESTIQMMNDVGGRLQRIISDMGNLFTEDFHVQFQNRSYIFHVTSQIENGNVFQNVSISVLDGPTYLDSSVEFNWGENAGPFNVLMVSLEGDSDVYVKLFSHLTHDIICALFINGRISLSEQGTIIEEKKNDSVQNHKKEPLSYQEFVNALLDLYNDYKVKHEKENCMSSKRKMKRLLQVLKYVTTQSNLNTQ